MSFEVRVLLGSILLPICLTVAGSGGAWWVSGRAAAWKAAAFLSAGWWLAISVVLWQQSSWSPWPEDTWRRVFWTLLPSSLMVGSSVACCASASWRWMALGCCSVACCWIVLPIEAGWSDLFPTMISWLALGAMAAMGNAWSLEQRSRQRTGGWCHWIPVGALGSAVLLTGARYASLAEWNLALIAASITVASLALLVTWKVAPQHDSSWTMAATAPQAMAISPLLISARLYGPANPWLLAILVSPMLLCGLDWLMERRLSSWKRAMIVGAASAGLLAAVAWSTYRR